MTGGALLFALGALWVWLVGRPTTLRLDRARNTCRLDVPRFFLSAGAVESFPLDRLRGVRVCEVTSASHDGTDTTYYEVRLETDGGRAHALPHETSKRAAERLARRIREFLEGGAESLTVRRFPWVMVATGVALALCGALLAAGAVVGRFSS